jgi:hypothetical protein
LDITRTRDRDKRGMVAAAGRTAMIMKPLAAMIIVERP